MTNGKPVSEAMTAIYFGMMLHKTGLTGVNHCWGWMSHLKHMKEGAKPCWNTPVLCVSDESATWEMTGLTHLLALTSAEVLPKKSDTSGPKKPNNNTVLGAMESPAPEVRTTKLASNPAPKPAATSGYKGVNGFRVTQKQDKRSERDKLPLRNKQQQSSKDPQRDKQHQSSKDLLRNKQHQSAKQLQPKKQQQHGNALKPKINSETLVAPLEGMSITSRMGQPASKEVMDRSKQPSTSNGGDHVMDENTHEGSKEPNLKQVVKTTKSNMANKQATNKRTADDVLANEDAEEGELQEAQVGTDSGKPAKKPKTENPYLIKRPHAPPKNIKPKPKDAPVIVKHRVNTRPTKLVRAMQVKRGKMNISMTLINRCIDRAKTGANIDEPLAQLRDALHDLEHFDFVTEDLVDESKLMSEGLPACFLNQDNCFPCHIMSDARAIFNRWQSGEYDSHLMRGIVTNRGTASGNKKVTSHVLEKDYPYRIGASHAGAGLLQNGQWWPFQICAVRDGAHGSLEGGIFGQHGKGAFSIVLSGGQYSDIDEGDTIQYCGTSGQRDKPTHATERMLESRRNGYPIRVIRSSAMSGKKSKYRPAKGLRYDGLYQAVDHELLDEDTSMYRFTLQRCPGQDPTRYEGDQVRPTARDLINFNSLTQQ